MQNNNLEHKALISVLLPVYNCEKYISQAVKSILEQSYPHFELLILNDGSTDNSLNEVASFDDSRIRIVNNEENIGLIHTLNKGIELSNGEYIARMDADDISKPERFETQVNYLLSNPDIAACGTGIETIGSKFDVTINYYEAEKVKLALLWHCPICHPSVMMRKSVLKNHGIFYNIAYKHAEDYKLWTDIAKVSRIANINKKLLQYRLHDGQITSTGNELQWNNSVKIISEQLQQLGIEMNRSQQYLHQYLDGHHIFTTDPYWEKKLTNWCELLIAANLERKMYPSDLLKQTLDKRLDLARIHYKKNISNLSMKDKIKYYLKKLLPEK